MKLQEYINHLVEGYNECIRRHEAKIMALEHLLIENGVLDKRDLETTEAVCLTNLDQWVPEPFEVEDLK